jgi:hypothetical protein
VLQRKPEASSFEFGLIVFYLAERDRGRLPAAEVVERRLDELSAATEELLGKHCSSELVATPIRSRDKGAWAGAVIVILRKEATLTQRKRK